MPYIPPSVVQEVKRMDLLTYLKIMNHAKSLNIGNYHTRTIESKNTLTLEQVKKLIEGSKGSKIHLMILFNVVMGLRCSEIIGIKYSDIDFVEQKLTVRRQLGRDIKKNDSELDAKLIQSRKLLQKHHPV